MDDLDKIAHQIQRDADLKEARENIKTDLEEFVKHYYGPFKARGFTIPEAYQCFWLHEIYDLLDRTYPADEEES